MYKIYIFIIIFIVQIYAQLLHPINNIELNYTHINFQWEKNENATEYQLQISKNINFNELLIDSILSSLNHIQKNKINWQSNYYWRLRAKYNNEYKEWSNIESFSTKNPSYIFAPLDVAPVEIIKNSFSNIEGITIFGVMDPFYSAAIDINGNEIWNSGGIDTYMFSSVDKNHNFFGNANLPPFYKGELGIEFDLDQGMIWSQPTYGDDADFLQHELIKLPNGNYLGFVITYKEHFVPNSNDYPEYFTNDFDFSFENSVPGWDGSFEYPWTWKSERIVEWNPEGEEVWSWSPFDHFNLNDFDFINGFWEYSISNNEAFDWTHFNAMAYDKNENVIYVSSKNLSRITKIDKITGNIIWHIGRRWLGESNIIEPKEQYNRFSGQHGLQLLNNNNLVIYDNGIASGINDGSNINTSRAMEIKILEINGEYNVEIIWSYTLPRELYGVISGNTQKLENNNYLITTVGSDDGAHILEVSQMGEIIWDCKLNIGTPQGAVYRAMRIPGLYESNYNETLYTNNYDLPISYQINSIYPNPFNSIVNIDYELSTYSFIRFKIFNIFGQEIDLIEKGYQVPGKYSVQWYSNNFSNGIYIIKMGEGKNSITKKITLLK